MTDDRMNDFQEETKKPWESKTVWALGAAIALSVLRGANIIDLDDSQMATAVNDLSAVGLLVYGLYGRLTAKKRISLRSDS